MSRRVWQSGLVATLLAVALGLDFALREPAGEGSLPRLAPSAGKSSLGPAAGAPLAVATEGEPETPRSGVRLQEQREVTTEALELVSAVLAENAYFEAQPMLRRRFESLQAFLTGGPATADLRRGGGPAAGTLLGQLESTRTAVEAALRRPPPQQDESLTEMTGQILSALTELVEKQRSAQRR